jgi:hypothetical protein
LPTKLAPAVLPISASILDLPFAVEPRFASDQVDVPLLEPGQLDRVVEVVDDLVAPLEHRRRIELAGHGLAGARYPLDLGQELARSQQGLGRHAGVESTFAADQLTLDQRDVEALRGQSPGADLARGPGADHDHVVFAHRRQP